MSPGPFLRRTCEKVSHRSPVKDLCPTKPSPVVCLSLSLKMKTPKQSAKYKTQASAQHR